jgi:hypothetical protein
MKPVGEHLKYIVFAGKGRLSVWAGLRPPDTLAAGTDLVEVTSGLN